MDLSAIDLRVDHLSPLFHFDTVVDVLRLDEIHPVVSGNKWFKLKEYLADAKAKSKQIILTFGGAYSNHIIASAAAAQMHGLKSIGVIRGEQPLLLSPTLVSAERYGMKLYFVSREVYTAKTIPQEVFDEYNQDEVYMIPEGGYGEKGMVGASAILGQIDTSCYTHIILATGTGTTLAGITAAAWPQQKVVGITVLKNNFSLQYEIENLLPLVKHKSFELLYNYHFGGYARYTDKLLEFMNNLYSITAMPTDFVYTGKVLFAAFDLVKQGYFTKQDRVLIIHTGGLQGNASLPKGTLIYG